MRNLYGVLAVFGLGFITGACVMSKCDSIEVKGRPISIGDWFLGTWIIPDIKIESSRRS